MSQKISLEEFNTKQEVNRKEEPEAQEVVKYQHPKILLIDLESSVSTSLRKKGYNVSVASLGTPYFVPASSKFFPVFREPNLPYDYKEHEIVVIDLHYKPKDGTTNLQKIEVADGVNYWWVSHERGLVNPRHLSSFWLRDDFDRILNTGGIFLIFADRFEVEKFHWGYSNKYYGFVSESSETLNNWGFLSLTSYSNYINIKPDHGSIISLSENISKDWFISYLLSRYLDGASYDCTVEPGYHIDNEEWISLLRNKFDTSVGGVFLPNEDREGYVFILPNILDKTTFILEFIDEFLPSIAPKLFPEIEKDSWINFPEYQLTTITQLKKQIIEIQEKARSEIATLEETIHQEQSKYSYLYNLVKETGDALVLAVQTTLNILGFSNVINVDKEIATEGLQGQNREDLQIQGSERTLIVEVKGITHYPTDEDALTVQKYVVLRMREWERVNLQGLTIINHQRHLPPFDRDNKMPFRQEILDAAEEQKIGLMTAWDLHRLARSYIENEWSHENIRDLFFQPGRIQPVPKHYEYIGTIERYIEKIGVIGIQIKASLLKRGERIAFELPSVFEEQICESLQHEKSDIEEAQVGMLVGVKTHLTKEQAKFGTRVFKVISKSDTEESKENGV